jgi:hypothetical protein
MRPLRLAPIALLVATLLATSVPAAVRAADGEPVYYLPAAADHALTVAQGNGDSGFRSRDERFAFDFVAAPGAPARFEFVAARGGTVMSVRDDVPGGRCQVRGDEPRPACWREVDYVLIDHGDGTSGLYLHMRPGTARVRVGEVVSVGQPLGQAGASGWTDRTGVQFQVQPTPAWNQRSQAGWFMTRSRPVAFSDPDVLAQRPDGVPDTGDTVVSSDPGAMRSPFRLRQRPTDLRATVPLELGAEREVSAAYEADSPDGYGIRFAPAVDAPVPEPAGSPDPGASPSAEASPSPSASPGLDPSASPEPPVTDEGTIVRPLFGGELVFAGCATGTSAPLGRMVAISLAVDDESYTAVLGHLSEIEPSLLDLDPTGPPLIIGSNELLGRYGVILAPGETPALDCPGVDPSDPTSDELFAAILRGATVTPEGEILGGTPVSLEPLVGTLAYEGLAWWQGPLSAVEVAEEVGRPRATWNRRTPAHASHVVFGAPIRLVARVRDAADIAQVRFRAYYPSWPREGGGSDLTGFDPRRAWRQLALCTPPEGRRQDPDSPCRWEGDAQDAVVTFAWDPALAPPEPSAPWLPRARPAMNRAFTECVPVSLAIEVIDTAGHVSSEVGSLPVPATCDQRSVERSDGRVIYLDPLVRPRTPATRGAVADRGWPPVYAPDPLDGAIVWRDRSDNEDGFRVYARRSYLQPDCSVRQTSWRLVTELPADTRRYRPRHARVRRSIDVPDVEGVPGSLDRWEYAVTAFNEAGETDRIRVGGFVGGSEAFCDPGLEPPPEL